MPQLRRIGRVWYSDLYVGGRRVRRPLHPDRRIAEKRLAELVAQRDDARYGAGGRDADYAAFKEKYLAFKAGHNAVGTLQRDRAALTALEDYVVPQRLSQITPEVLERWSAERRAAGRGAATINRDLRAVKTMLRKAEAWGYVTPRDWRGVKKLKEARGRLLFYTVQELRRLLRVCRGPWRTVCLLGARAGLRRAEIHWLSWEDVDLKRGRLHVCPKDGWMPKDHEQRWVPLAADLRGHLAGLPRAGRWVLGEGRPGPDVMTAYFRKLTRKTGLKGSVHVLRHTFASHLAMAGVTLLAIAKLLGHSSTRTTEIYAHLLPEVSEQAVARLPVL